jgi:hypothetical protein
MTTKQQAPQNSKKMGDPKSYDATFMPAFKAGLDRLSREELRFLDQAITPEVAFLMTKAFGPEMGAFLWPLIAEDTPAKVRKAGPGGKKKAATPT